MLVDISFYGELQVFTHFFAITPKELRLTNLIYKFAFKFVESDWKWDPCLKRNTKVIGKVWGGRLENNSQFRFPISLLKDFYGFLDREGFPKPYLKITVVPKYVPAKAIFNLKDKFKLYDYQQDAISFCTEQKELELPSVLLSMPTGTGKTVTLLAFASLLKLRMGVVVAPAHMEKWISDCSSYLGAPQETVHVVRGAKSIRQIFTLAESGDYNFDITLFSLRTLTEFFKQYELSPEDCVDLYGGTPMEMWQYAGIGLLGGDEVHEQFFAVYWMQTFIHGPFHVALSATMLHKDLFIEGMQKIVYPRSIRFDKIKMKKYINLVNVGYRFQNFDGDRIKTTFPRMSTYSQNAFEGSIKKNKKVLEKFLVMIHDCVDAYFIKDKLEGDKLGIYLARIELINYVVEYLKLKYPSLDIRRYAENDGYENVILSDIRVTTRGSAGTGVDIPGLTTVISVDNVDSRQACLQLLGRLREIPGREVNFIQLYCSNIKKHILYKDNRDVLFQDRIKGRSEHLYPKLL